MSITVGMIVPGKMIATAITNEEIITIISN
jgi:hypothetical protein